MSGIKTNIQKHLIKSIAQPHFKILLKLKPNQLEIIAINNFNKNASLILQDPNQYHQINFFKSNYTYQKLPQTLTSFFQSLQQLFNYIKSQNPSTIKFLSNKADKNNTSSIIPNDRVQFQIPAANKVIKRTITLKQEKPPKPFFDLIIKQIQDIENIQQAKKRIIQKKNQIKILQQKLTFTKIQLEDQTLQMKNIQKQINNVLSQTTKKQIEIKNIRQSFQTKNAPVVMKDINKFQQKIGSKINPKQLPQASKIYAAMPNPCQNHPLGKHIQFHQGKRTLFLKSKQITDIDLQGMIGYDWQQIQVLSFGGNKITNKGLQLLDEISQWQNVTHLYLFSNPITDITKIKFLSNLQTLSLYDLKLNQASCDFLIKTKFPKLKDLYLSFDQACIQNCWNKLANSGFNNFTALKNITIDQPQKISSQTRVKLNKLFQSKQITMQLGNPSLASLQQNCIIF